MEAKFSNRVKEVISLSREEALRLGHDYIGTEHLLLGVIREGEGVAISLLKKIGISLEDLRASVEQNTKNTSVTNLKNMSNIPLTRQTEKVLKITYLEAKIFESKLIGTEHLLLSISFSLPMTGSNLSFEASSVRSLPKLSSIGVFDFSLDLDFFEGDIGPFDFW
jgi:ATP-dependent Clp protease ATP-binding subunit ClpC